MSLRVGFLPLYQIQYASSRYRVFQFLEPLAHRGFKCTLIEAPQRNLRKRLTYLPRLLHLARSQDVLYVQKRLLPEYVLKLVCRINPHLIYDLDDAIFLRPQLRPQVDAILQAARVVVAGNEYLATYARKFNQQVVVIPTVVDADLYVPPSGPRHPGDERVIIGWIGSDPNRGDLAAMKPVFDWLGEHYNGEVALRAIGRRPLEMETRLTLEFIPWMLETYLGELQKFDIGIMPLEDTDWNRGKCGFKLIQYMAVGAATVASPVGVNQAIIQDKKTGYLAKTTEEWKDKLASLISDAPLRLEMGRLGRGRVERCYSVEVILPLLIDVLECGAAASRKGSR
ncbi:MAG: glycosyltransferase family 4 protein [Anaerolineae bacterium]